MFFDGPTIYSFFGIMSSHRWRSRPDLLPYLVNGSFGGRFLFFSTEFWFPKKTFCVLRRKIFDFHCRGLLYLTDKFRPIGPTKGSADRFSFMQQFIFKKWSFYICLLIDRRSFNMNLCYFYFKVIYKSKII